MFDHRPGLFAHMPVAPELPWLPRNKGAFGHIVPRDECWFHDTGAGYRFGGQDHAAETRWPEWLLELRRKLSEFGNFNSVMCNRYLVGSDSVAWHADDERELGPEPVIASVSLGATRRFCARHNVSRDRIEFGLGHGDLLIMSGDSQRDWQHCIPKTRKPVGPRINLTFRLFA